MTAWALNADADSGKGQYPEVPVIWEHEPPPDDIENWHEATEDEYITYVAFYAAEYDVDRGLPFDTEHWTGEKYRYWYERLTNDKTSKEA